MSTVTCECKACEGSGRIPVGAFGAYCRDGEKYDAPGLEVCEACDGTGSVFEGITDQREREAHDEHMARLDAR